VRIKTIFFFLTPALLPIIIFLIYPVLNTISLSFFSKEGYFVGLQNYVEVLGRKDIINLSGFPKLPPLGALVHNIIWILIHLPLSIVFGLIFAVIMKDVKGSSIAKSMIFLGMVTPMIVGGLILKYSFEESTGIVTAFFNFLGFESLSRSWTAFPNTALLALILGSVWLWTGFSMVLYSAGLAAIPRDYYEASKMDGATSFQIFYRITLPLLKPITMTVLLMTILWELKIFDIVFVATSGGPGKASTVLAYEMWLYAFRFSEFEKGAVIATFLTILTLFLTIVMIKHMMKK
jgi:multiple sugar transport system permease protein